MRHPTGEIDISMNEMPGKLKKKAILRSALRKRPWMFRHARKVLFGFFVVCLFLNDQWVGNFGPAHAAIVLLFALGCLGWMMERRRGTRRAVVRHTNLFYWITGAYFLWRLIESRHNIWFASDVAKAVLIVMAVAAYWLFDRKQSHMSFVCRTVPWMMAAAIAWTILRDIASGQILRERLAVTALGYGPELASVTAYTLGLHLFALKERPRMLWWYLVLAVLLVGQILAFQKDGVLAATIILAFFLFSSAARSEYRTVRTRILSVACTLVPLLVAVGIASVRIDKYSLGERFSLENASWSLRERQKDWQAWIDPVIADKQILLGVGLGAIKPINPGTLFFFRDPENVYVGMFGDFGSIGLALYGGLLVAFWKKIAREPDELRHAVLRGMFWVYVVVGLTGAMWRHGTITWFTAYLFYLFAVPRVQSTIAIKGPLRPQALGWSSQRKEA